MGAVVTMLSSRDLRGTSKALVGVMLSVLIFDVAGLLIIFLPPPQPYVIGPNSSYASSSAGLRLDLSVNSTTISAGQALSVAVSIHNTHTETNSVRPARDWKFSGVPIAMWPACYFDLPARIVVIKGYYSLEDLRNLASTPPYTCMEAVTIDHVIFQPGSDLVNLTGPYSVTKSNQTLGPFSMGLNFTTKGYWDLPSLSKALNTPILGEIEPASIAFVPGVYTVAVCDEWGQAAVVHFTVLSG
jgi:hypothetical protein